MPMRLGRIDGLRGDRVAVDDDAAVVGLRGQERLADPTQVVLASAPRSRDARPDARVREDVVADARSAGSAAGQERRGVRQRHGCARERLRLAVGSAVERVLDRRRTSGSSRARRSRMKWRNASTFVERGEEHLLVVGGDQPDVAAGAPLHAPRAQRPFGARQHRDRPDRRAA